jgi:hypothetical protein
VASTVSFLLGCGTKGSTPLTSILAGADFVHFEVCRFSRHESRKAADLQRTQVCVTSFKERPEAHDWMQVTEYGRAVYCHGGQTFRYGACRNTPGYRTFIKEVVRVGIEDVKLGGIHVDQMM